VNSIFFFYYDGQVQIEKQLRNFAGRSCVQIERDDGGGRFSFLLCAGFNLLVDDPCVN
jgi:hypothetical protein